MKAFKIFYHKEIFFKAKIKALIKVFINKKNYKKMDLVK